MAKDSFNDIAEDLENSLEIRQKANLPVSTHWYLKIPGFVRFLIGGFVFSLVAVSIFFFFAAFSFLVEEKFGEAFFALAAGIGLIQPHFKLKRIKREALGNKEDLF